MEHYVFLAILQYLHQNNECGTSEELIIGKITDFYSTVMDVVVNNDILISLAPKTPSQIKAKLRQFTKEERLKECGSVNILPL